MVCSLFMPVASAQEVVTFWYYGAQSDFDALEMIARDFEAENPGITIEIVNVPHSANWEKWAVAAAGGAPPDASMANFGIFPVLADVLEPLEKYVDATPEMSRDNFFPAHWEANWYGGHMLGLPFRANSQVMFYNKQAFAEAGIGDVPKNWQELHDWAARLTRRSGDVVERWGFSFRNAQFNRTVNNFAQRNGWQPFDFEYREAYFVDPKLIETIDFLNGMVVTGIAATPGMPGVGDMASGAVAMLNDGPWYLAYMRASNPTLEVGAFVPPAGPSGAAPYANMGGENLVMFKGAKNKEATWKWLTYLSYKRNADYNKATDAFFPVVRYAAADPHWFESDVWAAVLANYEEGALPVSMISPPCGLRNITEDAYEAALRDIFAQKVAAETALEDLQRMALAYLSSGEFVHCIGR